MRAWRVDDLGWWGEFIVRVTEVRDGVPVAVQGGPVLGDGYKGHPLRRLGIGGRLQVAFDSIRASKTLPRWFRWIVFHYSCGKCKQWIERPHECPQCGFDARLGMGGLSITWIHVHTNLWLMDSGRPTRFRKLIGKRLAGLISRAGRGLWCNDWRPRRTA